MDAQYHLGVTSIPQGDGRVELEVVPEIQHGPARQRWVAGDGLFRLDASRDSVRYDELKVGTTLVPGQTLIFEALPAGKAAGKAVAGQMAGSASPRGTLVMLRLAQTQLDDLFAPQRTLTPIATQHP